ncbi:unnamed protein product, partial [Owenia fusiformis]
CSNETMDVGNSSTEKRPIWYVFSGMGSQWYKMGRDLMQLDNFKHSIMKCHIALKPYGIDLFKILMEDDENVFNDTIHSFVGIASIQVALVDLLKLLGVRPDGILGHSV